MNKELINYGIDKLNKIMDEEKAVYLANHLYQYIDDISNYEETRHSHFSLATTSYSSSNSYGRAWRRRILL